MKNNEIIAELAKRGHYDLAHEMLAADRPIEDRLQSLERILKSGSSRNRPIEDVQEDYDRLKTRFKKENPRGYNRMYGGEEKKNSSFDDYEDQVSKLFRVNKRLQGLLPGSQVKSPKNPLARLQRQIHRELDDAMTGIFYVKEGIEQWDPSEHLSKEDLDALTSRVDDVYNKMPEKSKKLYNQKYGEYKAKAPASDSPKQNTSPDREKLEGLVDHIGLALNVDTGKLSEEQFKDAVDAAERALKENEEYGEPNNFENFVDHVGYSLGVDTGNMDEDLFKKAAKSAEYALKGDSSESKPESKQLNPDQYRKEHGKCPDGWRFDGKKCVKSK